MEALLADGQTMQRVTLRTPAARNPQRVFGDFLERLRSTCVLDPACGSGNFLYIALHALKDLEREAILWESVTLHIPLQFPQVGPHNLRGIEKNPYAAELTRVVIWIGEIQWMLSNGFSYLRDPVLRPLDNIRCCDAVLDLSDPDHPAEPQWPDADVIVGNPPFVGGKLMRRYLTDDYVSALFQVYLGGRVPREADYVCYWFEKARAMIAEGRLKRAGLLATQGIRGGASRRVLERIKETGDIFMARSDDPWILEGAAVHVSFLAFDNGTDTERSLDDVAVPAINANLESGVDITKARQLPENRNIAFMGSSKGGAFDIPAELARKMLSAWNPDGRSNADVVRPWTNGIDITARPRHKWIIDFGEDMSIEEAALYEAPFQHVERTVRPVRVTNRREAYAERWWLHVEARSGMREALTGLPRFVATPRVTKHRLFVWLPSATLADSAVFVFARDDDYFFGILHSRAHEAWARRQGTQLRERESGFRYTPRTTFETFPFPFPTDDQREAIAVAAKTLDTFRQGWLNPAGADPELLRSCTLTNLYNERPAWLAQAHERLDRAVLTAYGWENLSDEEIVEHLLTLNLQRSGSSSSTRAGLATALTVGCTDDTSK